VSEAATRGARHRGDVLVQLLKPLAPSPLGAVREAAGTAPEVLLVHSHPAPAAAVQVPLTAEDRAVLALEVPG
jgi:hypothetical protein